MPRELRSRKALLFAGGIFCSSFLLYLLTLCPSVYWGDSAELITVAYRLGIAHPPGHPLYTFLGKAFTYLPLGSIAYRVNLMSAFFAALSCVFLFWAIRESDPQGSLFGPAVGALFASFSYTLWDQATVAETTTLHCFFFSLLCLLAFRLGRKEKLSSPLFFSFIYGLSLSNHVAGVLLFPAFAYYLLSQKGKSILQPETFGKMLGLFLLGLLPYAYLPLRSLQEPLIDWGNPETLSNFLWVITAKQYQGNIFKWPTSYVLLQGLKTTLLNNLLEFGIVGCLLFIFGLFWLKRQNLKVLGFCLLVIGALFTVSLNTAFIPAYQCPTYLVMALIIGHGAQGLYSLVRRLGRSSLSYALAFLLLLCPLLSLAPHYPMANKRGYLYAYHYGQRLLEKLPPDSMLFTLEGNGLFILWYMKYCEGLRPDLSLIEPTWLALAHSHFPQLLRENPDLLPEKEEVSAFRKGPQASIDYALIEATLAKHHLKRPVYWGVLKEETPFMKSLQPQGLLYSYEPEEGDALREEALTFTKSFWEGLQEEFQRDERLAQDPEAPRLHALTLNNQGLYFEAWDERDLAFWAYRTAISIHPKDASAHYNLGRLYALEEDYSKAVEEYALALREGPSFSMASYNMGNAYLAMGKLDEAFMAYKKALFFSPDLYQAHQNMARLYYKAEMYDDAIKSYEEALRDEPSYSLALRGLGETYLAKGQKEEAIEALRRALVLEPLSPQTWYDLALLLSLKGYTNDAKDHLQMALKLGGDGYFKKAMADEALRAIVGENPTQFGGLEGTPK